MRFRRGFNAHVLQLYQFPFEQLEHIQVPPIHAQAVELQPIEALQHQQLTLGRLDRLHRLLHELLHLLFGQLHVVVPPGVVTIELLHPMVEHRIRSIHHALVRLLQQPAERVHAADSHPIQHPVRHLDLDHPLDALHASPEHVHHAEQVHR